MYVCMYIFMFVCMFLSSYKYDWKLAEAQKNILRTHTTAVSARMLYKLGQQDKFHPVKYFSIDRVFRNETLDATHLAEFHQIEGVVADYNITLGNLMGLLHEFFSKMGMYIRVCVHARTYVCVYILSHWGTSWGCSMSSFHN